MKRIFLLVATNVAILLVLSVTLRLLGVDRILDEQAAGSTSTPCSSSRRCSASAAR